MPLLDTAKTTYLPLDDYIADYNAVSAAVEGDIWKSERGQFFQEPGNESWEAYNAGRWEDALQASASVLPQLQDYFAQLEGRGTRFYRVRVVEFPLTGYLRWELNVLRVRLQAGERIRIAAPSVIDPAERKCGIIPELVLLGESAGYVVDYGGDGIARGAAKFDDGDLIVRCRSILSDLYAQSEDFEQFFRREVASAGQP